MMHGNMYVKDLILPALYVFHALLANNAYKPVTVGRYGNTPSAIHR